VPLAALAIRTEWGPGPLPAFAGEHRSQLELCLSEVWLRRS